VEVERSAANTPVTEKRPAAVQPPKPAIEQVPPPTEPPPLLQEETETAAPVPVPMPVKPETVVVEDSVEESEIVASVVTREAAPPMEISAAAPPANSEDTVGAGEALSDNDRIAHSGAAAGEGRSSPDGVYDGRDPLPASGPSETVGAGGDSIGETPVPQRDFSFIREKVQRNTRYPRLARQMGLEGKVKVSFTVCHDGQVIDIKVMKSSGVSMLDKCAVDAVKKTSPFPSRQLEARVIIPIVYRLNE
jgi:protein TonB